VEAPLVARMGAPGAALSPVGSTRPPITGTIATSGVGSIAGADGPGARPKKSSTFSVMLCSPTICGVGCAGCSGDPGTCFKPVISVYDSTAFDGVRVGMISIGSPCRLIARLIPFATIQPTPLPTPRQIHSNIRCRRCAVRILRHTLTSRSIRYPFLLGVSVPVSMLESSRRTSCNSTTVLLLSKRRSDQRGTA
jgi:hypothetical protein